MGQYYKPISLDSREWLSAREYDNGLKLMEHSWLKNTFVDTVVSLLLLGEKWWMNRIVWAGDYMDEGLFLEGEPKHLVEDREGSERNLYSYAREYFTEINPPASHDLRVRYLLNHDKKEFVTLTNLPDSGDGYRVHPLPLLTCSGNGRGGGDYYSVQSRPLLAQQREVYSKVYAAKDNEEREKWEQEAHKLQEQIEKAHSYVGAWAGDRISAEARATDIPKSFTEIYPNFKEA